MSLEFYEFIDDNKVAALEVWREALRMTGLPISFEPEANPLTATGFCRMRVDDRVSGCEITSSSNQWQEILQDYPALSEVITSPKKLFTFRIGSDLRGLTCIFVLAASLVETSQAVFYDPQENQIFTTKEPLIAQAGQVLKVSREMSES
jgi:hypothetical protein